MTMITMPIVLIQGQQPYSRVTTADFSKDRGNGEIRFVHGSSQFPCSAFVDLFLLCIACVRRCKSNVVFCNVYTQEYWCQV